MAFLAVLFCCIGQRDLHSQERKRNYDVPPRQLEAGIYLLNQKSLFDAPRNTVSLPFTWTKYHSDSLDWKLEGWVSYTSTRGDGWVSLNGAPGFEYWIDGATSVTPFLRLGFARDQPGRRSYAVYGSDLLLKRVFGLDDGAVGGEHRFFVLEMRAGFAHHHGVGPGARRFAHYFSNASVAYDWPVFRRSWDAGHRKRAKLSLGVENHFGAGRPSDRIFLATLSVRSESAQSGQLIRKVDMALGVDAAGRHRASVGFVRGF